jgi:hypothetical protein
VSGQGGRGLLRAFGREIVRLALDRPSRGPVPRRVDDVDADFMGRLLGAPVASVERLDGSAGTTERARFAVRGEGLPTSVFVKMAAPALVARLFGNLANLAENEVGFYRDVRPGLGIEAPRALGILYETRTKRFAIALEDLVARGAHVTDLRTPYTPERAGALLDTLAGLHGAFHASPRLDGGAAPGSLAWLRANGSDPLLPLVARALGPAARRLARRDASLAPEAGRALLECYLDVARELDAGVHTVLHGDPHPGNAYFADGRAGLFDWQVLRRGHPLRDVTYFLVLALEPETRRQHERALLERYAAALASAGGPTLAPEVAFATHRKMAAYPYVAATFTAGLGGLQEDPVSLEGLRRAVAAIGDLETPKALEAVT